jgi:aryl-alcohol dehydrogenase-like predicted oxidoreductase
VNALLETLLKPRLAGESAKPFLGAMNFGKRTSEAESKAILKRALDLGIAHIDTANAYN